MEIDCEVHRHSTLKCSNTIYLRKGKIKLGVQKRPWRCAARVGRGMPKTHAMSQALFTMGDVASGVSYLAHRRGLANEEIVRNCLKCKA